MHEEKSQLTLVAGRNIVGDMDIRFDADALTKLLLLRTGLCVC